MKRTILFLLLFTIPLAAQWQQVWTSANFPAALNSGWIYFDKTSEGWVHRLYTLDSLKFQIMEEGFSSSPAYTYYFNSAEILAGSVISSFKFDLNGDNKTDFYTLSQTVGSYPRQSFRIFDLTTNATIFEKNDASWYYFDPIMIDIDSDGNMECLVIKFDYPWMVNYCYEVYRTSVVSDAGYEVPAKFDLLQNFPNPFNPSTTIAFSLNKREMVSIKVYDIKGELVNTLLNEDKNPGFHEIEWNGSDSSGKKQSSGIYFYEMTTGAEKAVKKMILLK